MKVAVTEALLQGCKRGDQACFYELDRQLRPAVERFAFQILKDPEIVEDAAQEALMRIYKGLPGFRGNSQFATWAHRVVLNSCLRGRRRKFRNLSFHKRRYLERHRPHCSLPDEQLENKELAWEIGAALARLRPRQRELLVALAAGQSRREIAYRLGIRLNAANQRVCRAREAFGRVFERGKRRL